MTTTTLRPNLVMNERRGSPVIGPTGSRTATISVINSNIPARVGDRLAVSGHEVWLEEGTDYTQLRMLIVDGLAPDKYAGLAAGATVVIGGITYTVAANLQGAFPDIRDDDRITDEEGTTYLVMAVVRYDITRQLQADIAKGRAWT